MNKEVKFVMSDGLVIRGSLEGNLDSDNLVVMLHSGGYDRHEQGIKEAKKNPETGKTEKVFYNPQGNYDYLTTMLKDDCCVLRIDQRNHGKSGKNVDVQKLDEKLNEFNLSESEKQEIVKALHERDNKKISELATSDDLNMLLHRPPLKDMSFVEMSKDLEEVMKQLPEVVGKSFNSVDYVGTCMGTVVLGLYLENEKNGENVNSITLFSPLYTFDSSFTNTPEDAGLLAKKKQVIESGKQFRLGNAVEGKSTYDEVARFSDEFIENLKNLDIPTYCIQGTSDVLVPEQEQLKLFTKVIKNRLGKGLSEAYYAEIEGVHCLYDSLYPSLVEVSDFINANHQAQKTI